jgi:tRNA(Ile2) C34 agmatinyltransferase TiaS
MRAFIGFDDTDTQDSDRGTGKLARWFEKLLPGNCRLWGIVRQQLLIDERIPYTSHNSAACAVVDFSESFIRNDLILKAIEHIERESFAGSDPGLCVACEGDPALPSLIAFGRLCTTKIVTQKEAYEATSGVHLSGHGGTHDGIIGAAAAVGLTASGWCGRFIEFGKLRSFSEKISITELEHSGITVVSLDRDSLVPGPEDIVNTKGWLRPRLWGFKPVLPLLPGGKNLWLSIGGKNRK